ncbi:MAG TPA: methyltransferase domain-containing protein [Blastocatellia bacterium]|nr:methyltransferase domain-containing protein [Blastocatellia bacterium]
MDRWYLDNLVCPRDHTRLEAAGSKLTCIEGHTYPVVDGLPVMLLDDQPQTIGAAEKTLQQAAGLSDKDQTPELYLESLSLSEVQKKGIAELARNGASKIDPVVAFMIGATNGNLYGHLVGKLDSYPIPHLRLPPGGGQTFLDIGCNWGRWSIAAARHGYNVVGIDPQLGAVMAARRVSRELGLSNKYVVADARYLPFAARSFDKLFSYSVLQHLSKEDVGATVSEITRVLRAGGVSLVQMATTFGVRTLYNQARRRFRAAEGFEVRFWTIPSLKRLFSTIGKTEISVDCYFGTGIQESDRHLMPAKLKLIIAASEALRKASRFARPLVYVADSVYVQSTKAKE